MFFDGDDVMMPDYLEQLVKCMEFEDVDMVVGDVIKIAENGSELTEAPRIYTKMHDGRYDTTYKINILPQIPVFLLYGIRIKYSTYKIQGF